MTNRRGMFTDTPKGYHADMIAQELQRANKPVTDRPEHPNRGGRRQPLSYEETKLRFQQKFGKVANVHGKDEVNR